ncbi:hypothetical protein BU17DRAFT_77573 [Hysterangium stoloniferum]|nr:hypothetical protein BU17DRAFT_77573 [Hysterangium stoloniferum]
MNEKKIGVLGGGQLGRMLAASASLLINIPISYVDIGDDSPAKQIISPASIAPLTHIDGAFTSADAIRDLAAQVNIITVEIEHVNVDVLEEIQKQTGVEVHPSPSTLRIIQDKYVQKEHLLKHGLPLAEFLPVDSTLDGVNHVIREALHALKDSPLYAERWVPYVKEAAVMVVRTKEGEVMAYPLVETVHKENICHLVFAPFRMQGGECVDAKARAIAEEAVRTFDGAGVFGVEMFIMENGTISINEIAPRPHNSGHYTIEACTTSQYENHLRAILGLPLDSTSLIVPSAVMLNLIGDSTNPASVNKVARNALEVPGATVHLYGKKGTRKGRKMGYVTIVGLCEAETRDRLRPLLETLSCSSSTSKTYSETPSDITLYTPMPLSSSHPHPFPLVSIIMGSDSDLPVMKAAAEVLRKLRVPSEITIVSAHRTPERMVEFAKGARGRGVRVIIAGAGGAAHLPGMVAALTSLPVIGVPVKGSILDGVDSLHSIVQMPRGIPVATVAINNAQNGGLLAARILGTGIPEIGDRVEAYMQSMREEVEGKIKKLEGEGWEAYGTGVK